MTCYQSSIPRLRDRDGWFDFQVRGSNGYLATVWSYPSWSSSTPFARILWGTSWITPRDSFLSDCMNSNSLYLLKTAAALHLTQEFHSSVLVTWSTLIRSSLRPKLVTIIGTIAIAEVVPTAGFSVANARTKADSKSHGPRRLSLRITASLSLLQRQRW